MRCQRPRGGGIRVKISLTLKRDSSINRYPAKLREDEREKELLRAWIFIGEGLIVKDLKPESMEVTVAYRPRPQFHNVAIFVFSFAIFLDSTPNEISRFRGGYSASRSH